MADKNTGNNDPDETQEPVEDPEEVAAREAGNNATLTLVDASDDDSDSDSDSDEDPNPNSGEHVPHVEYAREV